MTEVHTENHWQELFRQLAIISSQLASIQAALSYEPNYPPEDCIDDETRQYLDRIESEDCGL